MKFSDDEIARRLRLGVIINEGEPQPVYCLPEDELRLTDAGGREMLVRIAAVAGRSALVTYRPPSDSLGYGS